MAATIGMATVTRHFFGKSGGWNPVLWFAGWQFNFLIKTILIKERGLWERPVASKAVSPTWIIQESRAL